MKSIKQFILKIVFSIPVPIKKNRIFFSTIPTKADNGLALYNYIRNNSELKFDLWWQSNSKKDDELFDGERYVTKSGSLLKKIKYYLILKSSKIVIITHHQLPIRKKQIMITLWHGEPFKKWDNSISNLVLNQKNNWFITSNSNTERIRIETYKLNNVNYFHSSQCRLSFFFDKEFKNKVLGLLNELNIKTFVIFMPTFGGREKNADFLKYDYDLINEFLKENGIHFFIKLHPHYSLSDFDAINQFSNIKVIDSNFFSKNNIELYSFLAFSKGLITDFSSVFIDYLSLNKPIAFCRNNKQDFSIDNSTILSEYFENNIPGTIIENSQDIINFIGLAVKGIDNSLSSRIEYYNFYKTDNGNEEDGPKNIANLIVSLLKH